MLCRELWFLHNHHIMHRHIYLALIAAALSLTPPLLQAEDAPLTLPATEPLITLALPDGFDISKVSIAISKAFVAETWENLGWDGDITTATTRQSRIDIKVAAHASATAIKFYAETSTEKKITEEKRRQVALDKVRDLERAIATELALNFRKAKGDETIDQATTS